MAAVEVSTSYMGKTIYPLFRREEERMEKRWSVTSGTDSKLSFSLWTYLFTLSPMTTKEYISKDKAIEIGLWFISPYMAFHRSEFERRIRSIPTFSPEKIIEEISEDFSYSFVNANWNIVTRNPYKKLLNTILERLRAESKL